jgi:signal transduction histidine kinase
VRAELRREQEGPRRGEWITVSVADEGPGIPPERHEHVFLEFTRLDPDAQRGAGVGLAISRRLARMLGGDITLVSEVGKGSTFTLWLPLSPVSQAAVPATQ